MTREFRRHELIELLRKMQGGRPARFLAEELGVTQQYLSDIFRGRRDPGESILIPLGLRREVIYSPIKQQRASV
jgi:transcriptional regulator with XRE-family HTH domain